MNKTDLKECKKKTTTDSEETKPTVCRLPSRECGFTSLKNGEQMEEDDQR
jgi:hypothetical protein